MKKTKSQFLVHSGLVAVFSMVLSPFTSSADQVTKKAPLIAMVEGVSQGQSVLGPYPVNHAQKKPSAQAKESSPNSQENSQKSLEGSCFNKELIGIHAVSSGGVQAKNDPYYVLYCVKSTTADARAKGFYAVLSKKDYDRWSREFRSRLQVGQIGGNRRPSAVVYLEPIPVTEKEIPTVREITQLKLPFPVPETSARSESSKLH